MTISRWFKLFVSVGYKPSVSGVAGEGRELDLFVESGRRLFRSRLPDFTQVTFTFPQTSGGENIQNFYHMDDYMIVSKPIHDAFLSLFQQSLESAPVRMLHKDGSSAEEPYFAARVNNIIDCIDPEQSTWKSTYSYKEPHEKFSAGIFTYVLAPEFLHEYRNGGGSKYISYPSVGNARIQTVKLLEDRIPPGTFLFQPMYWPGHWIVTSDFARTLEQVCAGRNNDYYFWTLDLQNVDASWDRLRFELR